MASQVEVFLLHSTCDSGQSMLNNRRARQQASEGRAQQNDFRALPQLAHPKFLSWVANLSLSQFPTTTNSPATKSQPKTTLLCAANQFGRKMSKLEPRSTMYRVAQSDSGHLPPSAASTAHSSRTITVRIAAQPNRRNTPATGSRTMLPARAAQITVCRV
jgi:hypothetical protein